jgi:hypothetical protein
MKLQCNTLVIFLHEENYPFLTSNNFLGFSGRIQSEDISECNGRLTPVGLESTVPLLFVFYS